MPPGIYEPRRAGSGAFLQLFQSERHKTFTASRVYEVISDPPPLRNRQTKRITGTQPRHNRDTAETQPRHDVDIRY